MIVFIYFGNEFMGYLQMPTVSTDMIVTRVHVITPVIVIG